MEDKLKQMRQRSNDLSDIVLEKDSKKTESTKKWLLTAASMILLFLIILVIMKMVNRQDLDLNENIASVGESVETLQANDIQDAPVENHEENLFKKEPIIDETSETDLKFEEMVRKLKEQDALSDPVVEKVTEVKKEVVSRVQEVKPQEIKPVVEVVKNVVTPVIEQAPVVVKPKPVVRPKPVIKHVAKREVIKNFPDVKIPDISGYFIQVGATAKSFPDRRFLTKIKRAGFDYIVHGVTIKGKHIKKVLVGPYNSRAAAKNALNSVKANLNPSAYIYRIK